MLKSYFHRIFRFVGFKTKASLAAVVVFAIAQLQIRKNKEDFKASYEIQRDTTRPGNKSFGLNYGFKTDLAVFFS
jgi:hypothetical protein